MYIVSLDFLLMSLAVRGLWHSPLESSFFFVFFSPGFFCSDVDAFVVHIQRRVGVRAFILCLCCFFFFDAFLFFFFFGLRRRQWRVLGLSPSFNLTHFCSRPFFDVPSLGLLSFLVAFL